jgi:intracellular sulfur oxidation DsrE/DsrF family protein
VSDSLPSHTPRRDFLARMAATAAVVIAGAAQPASLSAAESGAGIARRPSPDFDDSWTDRVRAAKHRVVLDSPDVGDGLALEHATVFMDNYHQMFGTGDAETVPVVVMRHMGTMLAMNDALWEKYGLGARAKLKDPVSGEETKRNPFVRVGADDKFALISPAATLPALHARGVVLLACNRALMHFADQRAKERNADVESVRAEFRAGLVPGVILQPSGVYAVIRAQEAGCGFLKST